MRPPSVTSGREDGRRRVYYGAVQSHARARREQGVVARGRPAAAQLGGNPRERLRRSVGLFWDARQDKRLDICRRPSYVPPYIPT